MPPITLNTLFSDEDLTIYEIKPGDQETQANISVADWKETLLAINVCNRRIQGLVKDIAAAEARIANLERLSANEETFSHS